MQDWLDKRIKQDEIDKYMQDGKDFICEEEILGHLKTGSCFDAKEIDDILDKSLSVKTLLPLETAKLIAASFDQDIFSKMKEYALKVKKKVYDNRIVTFAPLYLGNLCVNNCLYCGFRTDNKEAQRKVLSLDEIREESEALAGKIGHRRLIVVYGEHPKIDIDYICDSIKEIYKSDIRRVNVNAAPMSIEDLKRLPEVGIGTYQVFQETYHKKTYAHVHPEGTIKSNYDWRLYAMHRAFEAGIDDVGLGVLFGLYDWKFEVMSLLYHSRELEEKFGVGPHTISFPRLEDAMNAPYTQNSKYKVSDEDFKRIIVTLRLAVPHTGMILTAREGADFRRECLKLGITQTDASTKIGLGSYSQEGEKQEEARQQFMLGDTRSLDEVIREFAKEGFITSFCTAGYRCGRTGECIMDMLREGEEGKFCKLNAIITYREWLDDFASDETKKIAEPLIQKEIDEVKEKMPSMFGTFMEYYERTCNGERDLYL